MRRLLSGLMVSLLGSAVTAQDKVECAKEAFALRTGPQTCSAHILNAKTGEYTGNVETRRFGRSEAGPATYIDYQGKEMLWGEIVFTESGMRTYIFPGEKRQVVDTIITACTGPEADGSYELSTQGVADYPINGHILLRQSIRITPQGGLVRNELSRDGESWQPFYEHMCIREEEAEE